MNRAEPIAVPPAAPDGAQEALDQLLHAGLLGASRYIRRMNEVLSRVAESWPNRDAGELVATLRGLGDYFIASRGRNTPVIRNAVCGLLAGIEDLAGRSATDVHVYLAQRAAALNERSAQDVASLARHGANLLARVDAVLAFDYSSSVMAMLRELAEREHAVHVIVPESRCLDGGRPIAKEAASFGHQVTFTVDMAFAHFLRHTDAVLIGAEAVRANGDCLNTIGSYAIALVAQRYDVPFYVATELSKIDAGSFTGLHAELASDDLSILLGCDGFGETAGSIEAYAPELEVIPAWLIKAYVTPLGVLLPQHIRSEGLSRLNSMGIEIGA